MKNKYKCLDCNFKFKTKDDWFDIPGCLRCRSPNIKTVNDRISFFDIELSMESNRDFGAFFLRYGERISKNDVERKLVKIKSWIFASIHQQASQRRFKRFR